MKTFSAILVSIFIALMLLGGVGCKSVQPTTQVVRDSIYVEKTITVTDTVFKTEPALASITIPCDTFKKTLNPVSKTVKNATVTVRRSGNMITVDCFCDTVAIKAQLRHVMEKEFTARSDVGNTVKEVKYVPAIIKILAWCGGVALLALLILFAVFALKIFKK